MADTGIHPIPKQGKFRRPLGAVGAWLQALDYTGFDYTLDRTERLERELARLKEELRQSREASSGDAHLGGAVNLEHQRQSPVPSSSRLARQSRIAPHNGWNDCVHDPVDQAICLCLLSSSDSRGM